MTPEELDAISRACEAATPPPWKHGKTVELTLNGETYFHVDDIMGPKGYAIVETDSGVYAPELPDAQFICGAREWVPALVARVRELEADLSRRNDALATLTRLDERALCAALCDEAAEVWGETPGEQEEARADEAKTLASAIRARGEG